MPVRHTLVLICCAAACSGPSLLPDGGPANGGGATGNGGGSGTAGGASPGGGVQTILASDGGYGIPRDGFPSHLELEAIVLMNAARQGPQQFKAAFMTDQPNIDAGLNEAHYPPVTPLGLNRALNEEARSHSEDIANSPGCSFDHDSCDGGSAAARIDSYYGAGQRIAEIIGAGSTSGLSLVKSFLCDSTATPGMCATDGATDSHRQIVMDPDSHELGIGFARGGNLYMEYWTADFGGGTPLWRPTVAGTYSGQLVEDRLYLLNYYQPAAPAIAVSLVLDGNAMPATLSFGGAASGTWQVKPGALDAGCSTYHFVATDSAQGTWRYPETGELLADGLEACSSDYQP